MKSIREFIRLIFGINRDEFVESDEADLGSGFPTTASSLTSFSANNDPFKEAVERLKPFGLIPSREFTSTYRCTVTFLESEREFFVFVENDLQSLMSAPKIRIQPITPYNQA
jgi:hypothetical protein